MRKNILSRSLLMVLLLGVLVSCKSTKAVGTLSLPPKAASSDSLAAAVTSPAAESATKVRAEKLSSIMKGETIFNTLSGKAKAALNIGGNANDVNMNIRIRNKEAIWVSVTAIAGLEVARALITPDSVRVINRLENVYIKKPFSYLYEFTNNKINFATLQSVLVGNTISEFITESTEVNINGIQAGLKTSMGSMIYDLMVNNQNKVVQSNLKDTEASQSLLVFYGDFQAISQQQVPHSVVMKSQAKSKSISLDLKYTKIELDVPIEIPFKVPDRYTIKN